MKKILISIFVLMLTLLSGCRFTTGGAENDRRFIVAAVGFESDGALITVYAETIIINSETPENEPAPKLLKGSGATINEAFEEIEASLARPLMLEHCGVIAVGGGVTASWFDRICDYCLDDRRITLSSYMISCDSPEALLSETPESSVAAGYDIMGIIEQRSSSTGIFYDSRFFEIEGLREKGRSVFTLPFFALTGDGITLDGLSIYRDDRLTGRLSTDDAVLYSLMTGNFDRGTVRIGTDEYRIRLRSAEYDYTDSGENRLYLKLRLTGDSLDGTVCERLEQELDRLESRLRLTSGTDVVGFTDILSERHTDFDEKHGRYAAEFYKSSDFTVECLISGGI